MRPSEKGIFWETFLTAGQHHSLQNLGIFPWEACCVHWKGAYLQLDNSTKYGFAELSVGCPSAGDCKSGRKQPGFGANSFSQSRFSRIWLRFQIRVSSFEKYFQMGVPGQGSTLMGVNCWDIIIVAADGAARQAAAQGARRSAQPQGQGAGGGARARADGPGGAEHGGGGGGGAELMSAAKSEAMR